MIDTFFTLVKTNLTSAKTKLVAVSGGNSLHLINVTVLFIVIFFLIIDINFTVWLNQSILNFFLNYINYVNYFYLTISILFLLSIKDFIIAYILNLWNVSYNISFSNNLIYLDVLYFFYIKDLVLISFNFLFSYVIYFINRILSSSYITLYIYNTLSSFFTPISWYMIFKRHSIFGYYRMARQNWVELKSEEVNFLKY